MTQSSNQALRLYDIVSVMESSFGGQRAHEPVACIAAATPEAALATYHAGPAAFRHKDSGEAVEGLRLAAFESHKRKFCGPFAVVISGTTLQTVDELDAAVKAMHAASSAAKALRAANQTASVLCAQGWTVATC